MQTRWLFSCSSYEGPITLLGLVHRGISKLQRFHDGYFGDFNYFRPDMKDFKAEF